MRSRCGERRRLVSTTRLVVGIAAAFGPAPATARCRLLLTLAAALLLPPDDSTTPTITGRVHARRDCKVRRRHGPGAARGEREGPDADERRREGAIWWFFGWSFEGLLSRNGRRWCERRVLTARDPPSLCLHRRARRRCWRRCLVFTASGGRRCARLTRMWLRTSR